MSYPRLSAKMANECSQAAFAYSPECYCVFHWNYADFPPKMQYHGLWTKWLQADVWRTSADPQADKLVLTRHSNTGNGLLRQLRAGLAAITAGEEPDPSLPARHELPLRFQPRKPRKPIGFQTAAQRAEAQARFP